MIEQQAGQRILMPDGMSARVIMPRGAAAVVPPVAGYALWLDAADITTLYQDTALTISVTADGQSVKGWRDKSVSANNVIQGTAADIPIYKAAVLNGLGAVRFDGGDILVNALPVGLAVNAFSIFIVNKPSSLLTGNWVLVGPVINGYNIVEVTNTIRIGKSGVAFIATATTLLSAVYTLRTAIYTGARGDWWINGVADGGAVGVYTFTAGALNVGNSSAAGAGITGDICELIIYPSALNNADRAAVDLYLKTKWAL